ncbi:hypothetical protein [Streptomyces sp. NPDC052179]|uniref:hypothetical protein n=1 Tax=Streptomyces sp. NPDC052179 TaxID=3155680 RepID=UPI003440D38C
MQHELHPNGAGALRDAVDEANRRLAHLCSDPDTPDRRPTAGSSDWASRSHGPGAGAPAFPGLPALGMLMVNTDDPRGSSQAAMRLGFMAPLTSLVALPPP